MGKLNSQKIALLSWILFSIFYIVGSLSLEFGTLARPGPGLMPQIIGIFIGITSLVYFFAVLKSPEIKGRTPEGENAKAIGMANIRKQLVLFAGVVVYCIIITRVGFLISTFVLMLILFKGIETQKWSWAIVATIVTVILSYYIFVVLLQCQFPTGFFK